MHGRKLRDNKFDTKLSVGEHFTHSCGVTYIPARYFPYTLENLPPSLDIGKIPDEIFSNF